MGLEQRLYLVDHENFVVRLPRVMEEAKTEGSRPLREFLLSLVFPLDPEDVAIREARIARLEEVNAPQVIVRIEREELARTRGPERATIEGADQEGLGRIAMSLRIMSVSIGSDRKLWDLVHWYCDPERRQRRGDPSHWRTRRGKPTVFDHMIFGAQVDPFTPMERDVWRRTERYNPPDVSRKVHQAAKAVDVHRWDEVDLEMGDPSGPTAPYFANFATVAERLEAARADFQDFLTVYGRAASRGWGVLIGWWE